MNAITTVIVRSKIKKENTKGVVLEETMTEDVVVVATVIEVVVVVEEGEPLLLRLSND